MKTIELFENDKASVIKMLTQGIRHFNVNIQDVEVAFKRWPEAKPKACYNNAFSQLGNHPDDKYVLGFVFVHNIPIEHAWIKDSGNYIDGTLDPKKQEGYVSVVEFSFDDVYAYADKHGHAPSLYDMNRFIGTSKK